VRPALIAAALLAAAGARAGTPLAISERQVVTLEFDRAVAALSVTDPEVVALRPAGARVVVTGMRAGRAAVEVSFEDGTVASYEVTVAGARRTAGSAAAAPGELVLAVGEERRLQAAGVERVFLEENGVARVRVDGAAVRVTALAPGAATLVLVDGKGARTTHAIRVR
jgi:hypothetical protein